MSRLFSLVAIFFLVYSVEGQSIRKNYTEMTDSEKTALVNAFYALRNGPDIVNDLAVFHRDFFSFGISPNRDIHNNLMDEPEDQIFFAWHRMQIFEMEQAMQEIDPNISIPYWDSSIDQSTTSSLWDQNFMGSFDANWSLDRVLGSSNLPSPAQVTALQAIPGSNWPPPTSGNIGFYSYANNMERGSVHVGAHVWVEGAMRSRSSPRDPIFYLHHGNVDRLWDEWEKAQLPGQGSFHITSTTMLRYDGTYNFDGEILPQVDPDFIADNKVLGVFYAQNQLAELSDYTTSIFGNVTDIRQAFNEHTESFYYQYLIRVGNNFTVPSGARCHIESVNEIELIPGFEAIAGSSFVAEIDQGTMAPLILLKEEETEDIVPNKIPFDLNDDDRLGVNAYDFTESIANKVKVVVFPNPFLHSITVQLDTQLANVKVTIFDVTGKIVYVDYFEDRDSIRIQEIHNWSPGMYIIEVSSNDQTLLRDKIIRQ
ncbi:tyrosinase family protein [uncultured Eudoraea sp.]|uniref:tyrosinase family protein n=1 Tax=uncultured Eudoraea sp. TaxID=1035614 RepID=UPI002636941C|nr:tyrosinase family protein [uncultured Eudoraea sp.]